MRTIKTENRFVTSLSKEAREEVLLLKGPRGARVIVMSPKAFVQNLHPKQSRPSEDAVAGTASKDNVLRLSDYVLDL